MNAKIGKLVKNDFVKGLAVAVLTAVLTLVYNMLQSQAVIDLKTILITGLIAGIGYLLKNLATNEDGKIGGVI